MNIATPAVPVFKDRIEKKFQLDVKENEVADIWRELGSILAPYGMLPVQEFTSALGSVYFDNKDCDRLRYILLGRLLLIRLRAYVRARSSTHRAILGRGENRPRPAQKIIRRSTLATNGVLKGP